jgi:hypothetical protein
MNARSIERAIRRMEVDAGYNGWLDPVNLFVYYMVRAIRARNELKARGYFSEETISKLMSKILVYAYQQRNIDPEDVAYKTTEWCIESTTNYLQARFADGLAWVVMYDRILQADDATRHLLPELHMIAEKLAKPPKR